jgi:hypothetical protein
MDNRLPPVTLLFDLDTLEKMGLDQALLALRSSGVRALALTRAEINQLASDRMECWLCFGSIAFIREARKHLQHQPLAYYSDERFYYSRYAHKLPAEWMLNAAGVFLPCTSVLTMLPKLEQWFGGQQFFMRPDSGAKVFTGQMIEYASGQQQIDALSRVSSLTRDTMVYVAGEQPIEAEYRLFIVNRKVVGGSFYTFGEWPSASPIPAVALELAQAVAQHPWQIDIAYSCDIALTTQGARVVELNAGSTSGFYNSDAKAIIEAMMVSAWLEYQGDLTIED